MRDPQTRPVHVVLSCLLMLTIAVDGAAREFRTISAIGALNKFPDNKSIEFRESLISSTVARENCEISKLDEHMQTILQLRCGSVSDSDESEDEDEDLSESEEEDDEEEEEAISKLKSSLEKKLNQKSKRIVNVAMEKSKPIKISKTKKRRKSILKMLRVPYIIRASLNPFTVFTMTRLYFASLFDINFMDEDSAKGLRSAMEEKAKKDATSGGRKRKRVMKPGQAKTLSDLPVLSA